jgi:cell shape-determining protein MreC
LTKQEFFNYALYFSLCSLLLYSQWGLGLTPRGYVEPTFDLMFDVYELALDGFQSTALYVQSRSELINRLNSLQRQNQQLRQSVYEGKAAIRENRQLRRYLNLPEADQLSIKPAEILQRNLSGWEQTLRVNRGAADGYRPNQLAIQVLGDSWIVRGKVHSVTEERSVIVLSSDPRFKIGVQVEGILGRQFVARGWGYRGLRIEHFPQFLTISRGSSVYTAPNSVIAAGEYYVGEVVDIGTSDDSSVGRRVQIQPPELSGRRVIWVVTGNE